MQRFRPCMSELNEVLSRTGLNGRGIGLLAARIGCSASPLYQAVWLYGGRCWLRKIQGVPFFYEPGPPALLMPAT